MKWHLQLGAAALVLALAGCGDSGGNGSSATGSGAAAVAPIPAPNGGDWTETIAMTPEGGFRMGNPDAPVKLVEYASLTCPHCADFSQHAAEPLKNEYVRTGRVSWEYRNFVLNAWDVAISVVQRCQGPQPAFKLVEQIYADQPNWIGRMQAMSPADQQRIGALTGTDQLKAMFAATGLSTFFGQRGVPQSRIDQCLSDQANVGQIEQILQHGQQDGVTGTPTFLINGKIAEAAADWNTLRAQLNTALGS